MEFHARGQRFAAMVLHRRAGKTVACINDMIDKALQNTRAFPQPRYAYIAPQYKQAKDIVWAYLKYYTENLRADKPMESELSVTLKNGARIRLYGSDNPDSIRGAYLDGVIFDEFGDMSPRIYPEIVLPMLSDYTGWAVFIGTPKGSNHFRDLVSEAEARPDWYTKILRASESGIIPKKELELIRTSPGMEESTFLQEMECSFEAANRGSFYAKILNEREAAGAMGDYPYDPEFEVLTAWDIGYSDDTSIWFFQSNGKEIKVIDFFTVSGYSVDDVLAVLTEKEYAYGQFYLPHDAKNKSFQTGKSTRELMTAAGCKTAIVPSLSVQDGIQAVRATLPTVYFNTTNSDVKVGLSALKSYEREYDDKRGAFRESPKHDWASNPADAFRMLALAMNPTAARKDRRIIVPRKEVTVTGNVMNLENLFQDRANAAGTYRRI